MKNLILLLPVLIFSFIYTSGFSQTALISYDSGSVIVKDDENDDNDDDDDDDDDQIEYNYMERYSDSDPIRRNDQNREVIKSSRTFFLRVEEKN